MDKKSVEIIIEKELMKGSTIRETAKKLGVPKSGVEKVSKSLHEQGILPSYRESSDHLNERARLKCLKQEADKKGYDVYVRGYPDMIVVNRETKRTFAIEEKSSHDSLRVDQIQMIKIFEENGIPVCISINGEWVEPPPHNKLIITLVKIINDLLPDYVEAQAYKMTVLAKEMIVSEDGEFLTVRKTLFKSWLEEWVKKLSIDNFKTVNK